VHNFGIITEDTAILPLTQRSVSLAQHSRPAKLGGALKILDSLVLELAHHMLTGLVMWLYHGEDSCFVTTVMRGMVNSAAALIPPPPKLARFILM
jgi:hypothetical protein